MSKHMESFYRDVAQEFEQRANRLDIELVQANTQIDELCEEIDMLNDALAYEEEPEVITWWALDTYDTTVVGATLVALYATKRLFDYLSGR